jgi:hypothetical protein
MRGKSLRVRDIFTDLGTGPARKPREGLIFY